MPDAVLDGIDHLIFAAADLDAAVGRLAQLTGITASAGGSHPGRGSRNALLRIGARRYLEVMAPDPAQVTHDLPAWFPFESLGDGGLMAWCARASGDLRQQHARAADAGVPLGAVREGRRARPDGGELSWVMTEPTGQGNVDVLPFLIDWGSTPHPSESAAAGLELIEFRLEHPDPQRIRGWLDAIGLAVLVAKGAAPALVARLSSPRGEVELQSPNR